MDSITEWHIEPTSKCILECPLCDRTWFYKKFKKRLNHEINIDHLLKFFKNQPRTISMCGNNGDPIYHSKFHELCRRLKSNGSTLHITTNGSGKNSKWWEELCTLLTKNDKIIFSIDGLEDTNYIYRKNAKWQSILDAIHVVSNHEVKSIWKFIVFKHNEHQIEKAKSLSKILGIHDFFLVKSNRWWNKDMMPSKKYVDERYDRQIKVSQDMDIGGKIIPKCISKTNGAPDQGLYIDAEGDFYPCCYTGLYAFRYKNIFSPKHNRFNIKNNTYDTILEIAEVKNFFQSIKSYETADKCCKIYCGVKNG